MIHDSILVTKLLLEIKTKQFMTQYREKNLFEISWEVCNKVGGIHTVITSKIPQLKDQIENYYLIGPYTRKDNSEFVEETIPDKFKDEYNQLKNIGIILHFGKWLTKGYPDVILIEYMKYSKNINSIKGKLWDMSRIDSLNSSFYDFDEAILWSWTAGITIEKLSNKLDSEILVQSHEWMSGGAIFYLKQLEENNKNKNRFKTIFTTHATMLGRTISTNEPINYKRLNELNCEEKSYQFGINTKFQTERALANISDSFTTVSDITAKEAKDTFKKEVDTILYNGFNTKINPTFEDTLTKFENSRKKTNEFIKGYFNDFYNIDTDKTQIIFTSGRNEFENKGIDIFIDSLGELNNKLKENNQFEKNIIAFFTIPVAEYSENKEILKSINNYKNNIKPEFEGVVAPISTHDIDTNNKIIQRLVQNNLINHINDKVKVIIIPRYLDGTDGVINRSYYEFTRSFDLSIFVSNYEPWGYTPLESISYSVPTITTNVTGFGIYCSMFNSINKTSDIEIIDKDLSTKSVKIIDRNNSNNIESTNQLTKQLLDFYNQTQSEILIQKKAAFDFSKKFDWENFISNYFKAFTIAKNK